MGRAIEGQVIERFITCGDPREGFARIYCDACLTNSVTVAALPGSRPAQCGLFFLSAASDPG
jgi:hypothetical protein